MLRHGRAAQGPTVERQKLARPTAIIIAVGAPCCISLHRGYTADYTLKNRCIMYKAIQRTRLASRPLRA